MPELTEIRRPDGRSEVRTFDRGCLENIRWDGDPGSDDRQGQGRVVVIDAGVERVIEIKYRASDQGVEFEMADAADPSGRTQGVVVGLEPAVRPGERIVTHNPLIGIVVLMACYILQEEAMDDCIDQATEQCGRGRVRQVRYTGYCGILGECEIICR